MIALSSAGTLSNTLLVVFLLGSLSIICLIIAVLYVVDFDINNVIPKRSSDPETHTSAENFSNGQPPSQSVTASNAEVQNKNTTNPNQPSQQTHQGTNSAPQKQNEIKARINQIYSQISTQEQPRNVDQKLNTIEQNISELNTIYNNLSTVDQQVRKKQTQQENILLNGLRNINSQDGMAVENLKRSAMIVDKHRVFSEGMDSLSSNTSNEANGWGTNGSATIKSDQKQLDSILNDIRTETKNLQNIYSNNGYINELYQFNDLLEDYIQTLEEKNKKEAALQSKSSEVDDLNESIQELEMKLNYTKEVSNELGYYVDKTIYSSNLNGSLMDAAVDTAEITNKEWAQTLQVVLDGFEQGRYGRIEKIASEFDSNETDSQRAQELIDTLSQPEEYTESGIESTFELTIDSVEKYDRNFGDGNKDVASETVENTADRVKNKIPDAYDLNISPVVTEYIDNVIVEPVMENGSSMLNRYTAYHTLTTLEDIFEDVERPEYHISGSLETIADETAEDITKIKERRDRMGKYQQANILVDHFIDLVESLYEEGELAMESGNEKKARECFRITSKLVENIHEMYEGDKKKMLARAANI